MEDYVEMACHAFHGTYHYMLKKGKLYKILLGGAGGGGSSCSLHYRSSDGKSGAWQEYYLKPSNDILLEFEVGKGGDGAKEDLITALPGKDGGRTIMRVITGEPLIDEQGKPVSELSIKGGEGGTPEYSVRERAEVKHYLDYGTSRGAKSNEALPGGDGMVIIWENRKVSPKKSHN